jgi:phosphohistidine phosphatase SixA
MLAYFTARIRTMLEALSLRVVRQCLAMLAIGLLLTGLMACTASGEKIHSKPGTTTKIILTRHAERTSVTKVLTPKGQQRARDLVTAVEGLDVVAIYCPDLERNLDTARPLAQHLGIDITVKPAKSTPLVRDIVADMLDNHAGKTVLWVGNVGNLNEMYWHLDGDGDGPIVYGDLFVITVPEQGPTSIEKRRFGSD